jgi:capsular polysaccharide biosynthesis protein
MLTRITTRAAAELRRLNPPPRLPFVTTFDAVRSAETVDADLPREQSPVPRTRTEGHRFPSDLVAPSQLPTYPLRVAVIPDGRLTGSSGAVVTPDGLLVLESLWDYHHWQRSFDPPERLPTAARLRGTYASLVTLWGHGLYHWLFEALPRLAVLHASGVQYDGIIVPDPVAGFMRDTLNLAGVPDEKIVPFTGNHLHVDELIWCAPLSPVSYPTPYEIHWLRTTLGVRDVVPTRRAYLPRTARGVVNEREVVRILRDAGFEAFQPSQMDFRAQIDLWSEVRYAAGPHGAAFSNSIFSKEVTALEFYQGRHVNVSFPALLAAAGQEHWTLMGRRVPTPNGARHHKVHVPPARLRATLRAMRLA